MSGFQSARRSALCLFHGAVILLLLIRGDAWFAQNYRRLLAWANEGREATVLSIKGPDCVVRISATRGGEAPAEREISLDSHTRFEAATKHKAYASGLQRAVAVAFGSQIWDFFRQFGTVYAAALTALVLWRCDPARRRHLALLAVSIAVTGIVVWFLQHMVGRLRPSETVLAPEFVPFPQGWRGGANICLPSGHATFAFTLAAFLSFLNPKTSRLFYGLAALTALSRIVDERHWLADVYVAALVGVWITRKICAYADPIEARIFSVFSRRQKAP